MKKPRLPGPSASQGGARTTKSPWQKAAVGLALAFSLTAAGGTPAPAPKPVEVPAPATAPPKAALPIQDAKEPVALGTMPAGMGLAIGTAAPNVQVTDTLTGAATTLDQVRAKLGKPFFLVFYRGGWCPYCNFQVRGLSQTAAEFEKRGLGIVMVSAETPANQASLQATYNIVFPVLSDGEGRMLDAFHVKHEASAEEYAKLKGYGTDLEARSGTKNHAYATPAVFLIDRAGKVRWGHVDPDASRRATPRQLLAVADGLKL